MRTKANTPAELTAAEIEEARAYNRQRNREWWNSMDADERRARRQRYALNAARRKTQADAAAAEMSQ